jgi:AcrR family transcriptional regulator
MNVPITDKSTDSPENGRPGRVAIRRAKARQRILETAERLFSERGFDGVTVDDIAEEADIARRSFYHHFESKHEVMVPIARERTKSLNRRIDRTIEAIEDPAEVMATGMRYGFREISSDPLCRWFVLHSGLPQERLYEGMGESGMRDIQRAVEAGRFSVANENVLSLIIFGSFLSVVSARVDGRLDDNDLDDTVELLLRTFGLDADEARDIAHRPLKPLRAEPRKSKKTN